MRPRLNLLETLKSATFSRRRVEAEHGDIAERLEHVEQSVEVLSEHVLAPYESALRKSGSSELLPS